MTRRRTFAILQTEVRMHFFGLVRFSDSRGGIFNCKIYYIILIYLNKYDTMNTYNFHL